MPFSMLNVTFLSRISLNKSDNLSGKCKSEGISKGFFGRLASELKMDTDSEWRLAEIYKVTFAIQGITFFSAYIVFLFIDCYYVPTTTIYLYVYMWFKCGALITSWRSSYRIKIRKKVNASERLVVFIFLFDRRTSGLVESELKLYVLCVVMHLSLLECRQIDSMQCVYGNREVSFG